jgi:hypothetical protein
MTLLRHTQSNSADHVIKVMGSNPALAVLFAHIFQIPAQLGGIRLHYYCCWLFLTVLYLSTFKVVTCDFYGG